MNCSVILKKGIIKSWINKRISKLSKVVKIKNINKKIPLTKILFSNQHLLTFEISIFPLRF